MRAAQAAHAAGFLLLAGVFACGPSVRVDKQASAGEPVVTEFTDNASPAIQASNANQEQGLRDLELCRRMRSQGVYARERRFPCEAFLGQP
jgi:hypothetical protein